MLHCVCRIEPSLQLCDHTTMAKKQAPPGRRRTQTNSKTKAPTKPKPKAPTPATATSKTRSRNRKSPNDADENPVIAAPSSSEEAIVSTDAEEIEQRTSADEVAEEEEEEGKEPKSGKKKGRNKDVKNKRKRRGKEEEDVEDDPGERGENRPYTFPMNRVDRIIRSEIPDLKISQEAVFLINRSTEKFLQLFCKEAYACTFLDKKSYVAYNHLSSVVSKRERLKFLSDFIPEKVKAEDALAQIGEAEK